MAESSEQELPPVLELKAEGSPSATARLQVAIGEDRFRLAITVPTEPVPLRTILPVLQGLTNAVVTAAELKVHQSGERISCAAGCGACCRQLVPISPSEAHALQRLVESMPSARRETILARFSKAQQVLLEADMLESLQSPSEEVDEGELASRYFRLGIPCPFLEDESCSIHKDRPLVCREYLVTSPAEECSRPGSENVRCVPLSAKTSWALRAVDWDALPIQSGWVPMVLALKWASTYPEPDSCTGPQWVQNYLTRLAQSPKS